MIACMVRLEVFFQKMDEEDEDYLQNTAIDAVKGAGKSVVKGAAVKVIQ